jgi:benzoyl-CoA reductase/2-hydroxyglutaryl-CoA dehydratase subunit BcrC/BadD/HgdB
MIELLNLCGFESHELESQLPRIRNAFDKIGITDEDIERAKQRLNTYFDTELKGVRKCLRLCIQDLVNIVLAREEGKTKIVYGYMSLVYRPIASIFMSRSKEAFFAMPFQTAQTVLGHIFGKLTPILEAAEHKWLKAGRVSHCANLKTVVGLIASDLLPKPDLIVTSGYMCDTAPKTADLLHELYGIPICYQDTCEDRQFSDYPNADSTVNLMAKSLRKSVQEMQELVGVEITDDAVWEVLEARSKMGASQRRLQDLLEESDPLPISHTNDVLLMSTAWLALSANDNQEQIDAIDTLYEELQERVNKGVGVMEKGAPRVLATIPPHSSDPRLEHLLNEVGIVLVSTEGGFYPPDGRRAPDVEKSDDPYKEISLPLLNSMGSNTLGGRISILAGACKRFNVDGILVRSHVACRQVAGDVVMIKNAITKELGIPALLFEWESFDPRVYNHEQYKRRLELFKSMLISSRQ